MVQRCALCPSLCLLIINSAQGCVIEKLLRADIFPPRATLVQRFGCGSDWRPRHAGNRPPGKSFSTSKPLPNNIAPSAFVILSLCVYVFFFNALRQGLSDNANVRAAQEACLYALHQDQAKVQQADASLSPLCRQGVRLSVSDSAYPPAV